MSIRLLASGLPMVLALTLSGCVAAPAEDPPEDVESVSEEIKGGYTDETDTGVVGIVAFFSASEQGICTGSLIAPNVVLTARHCVSNIVNGDSGVICSQTGFTAPLSPNDFLVTTKTFMPQTLASYHKVREVLLLPVDNLLCGQDQAILILDANIDPAEAVPLVPRVDVPLVSGEQYYAVGYGATDDFGTGATVRRRRDNLFIDCVAEECPATFVKPTEFVGDTGICQGDSGGPALDLINRVIGVTSRGNAGCTNPVYGYVLGWAQWVKDSTIYGAQLGGYDAPAWATGFPTDPAYTAPIGGACGAPEECPGNVCLSGSCSRPCTDIATCPSGYTCNSDQVCKKKKKKKSTESTCAVSQPGVDPTAPVPWLVGAGLGALAMLRRRRPRG